MNRFNCSKLSTWALVAAMLASGASFARSPGLNTDPSNGRTTGMGIHNGIVNRNAPTTQDLDGDGVSDQFDDCPHSSPSADVNPKGCEHDNDVDGVPDYRDSCLSTPPNLRVDYRGCGFPRTSDSDQDGVPDNKDRCPHTLPNAKVDADGCAIGNRTVLPTVNFEFDSARLLPISKTVLNRVVESMNARPNLRVRIDGHTDSIGGDAYNLALSGARANSVRRYLIAQGVQASRLNTKAYGESRPIADNSTASGQAINRRVELTTIAQ